MAPQGFLVDQQVMTKASTDFDTTANTIRALMRLNLPAGVDIEIKL